MPAGSIVVELLARTGSFETDIDRATKNAEKRFQLLSKGVRDSFAGNLLANAVTQISADIGRIPLAIIDSIDKLNDLADATGSSIENISALEDVGARTGTTFETVSAALVKFNQQLQDTDPDSKAARALRQIGLNADDLRKMDPAQALLTTALALDKFADDGDKARLVQELFGKSVREVAPFLKDLAEKGELNAKVTTEQAKEAEAFNKQLFDFKKNSEDASRAFMSSLLPAINAAAKAWKESGLLEGLRTLLTGTDVMKAQQDVFRITGQILDEENRLSKAQADLKKGPNPLDPSTWFAAEKVEQAKRNLDTMREHLRSAQALLTVNAPDFFRGAPEPPKPGVGPIVAKPKKEAAGKDEDADFKRYLNQLQEQISKVEELTLSEKLLADIRRGALTVTPEQEAQLQRLAKQIDEEREAMRIAKERQALRNKEYADAKKFLDDTDAETRQRLQGLLALGPQAKLEKQRADLMFLAQRVEAGLLDPEAFEDAATGMLGLNQAAEQGVSIYEELATVGTDALHALAIGGQDVNQVFKSVLLSVADLIFKLGVVEPIMDRVRTAMKTSGGGGGDIFGTIASAVAGMFGFGGGGGGAVPPNPFAGARAGGGDVMPGRSYLVGEQGAERFVPRTFGMVLPAGASGADGGGSWTLHNYGRPAEIVRVDPREKAIWLQEARRVVAADIRDRSSAIGDALAASRKGRS